MTDSTFDEPIGFAQWLGAHCPRNHVQVPRAGTPRRRILAAMYRALTHEGIDITAHITAATGEPEAALCWAWATLPDLPTEPRKQRP